MIILADPKSLFFYLAGPKINKKDAAAALNPGAGGGGGAGMASSLPKPPLCQLLTKLRQM